MPNDIRYSVITDIGSTTTKAILLEISESIPRIIETSFSPTTVEKPFNDVRFGVINAIRELEQKSGLLLLEASTGSSDITFRQHVSYLSTSSAGGGLQILVIGLTMFDSATSAKRAAYGAGGVILDTFAIDDKRQAMQQMLAMRALHPDMILLCGGTDGGAISGVLRMAEILRVARPLPKFDSLDKIPVLYAGNKEAAHIVKEMASRDFDLYILPNLRPDMENENLGPTQDKIQDLFMENVMEHAPGYSNLKKAVSADILPTPSGVLQSLKLLSNPQNRNIFAFDIGGATTDVFSYINSHFQRTVSANMGMSYSALNVLKECGIAAIMHHLPADYQENEIRNYIGNKCLNPTYVPQNTRELRVEHAMAVEAMSSALAQHQEMHYNTNKIGFLDKLRDKQADDYERKFEYTHMEQKHYFHESDIDVLIGAGGIFAHTSHPMQACMMLIDAARPKGVTEISVDRQFMTPHLGVYSTIEPAKASKLLDADCILPLAMHIAPILGKDTKKPVMSIDLEQHGNRTTIQILPDQLVYLPPEEREISVQCNGKAQLGKMTRSTKLSTSLPVIIDTRIDPGLFRALPESMGNVYHDKLNVSIGAFHRAATTLSSGKWIAKTELPYKGDILMQAGDITKPDDVIAYNRYNPPRMFIVDPFSSFRDVDQHTIAESLKVTRGESVDFDQVIGEVPDNPEWLAYKRHSRTLTTPVRGKIEYIDPRSGLMVLSEIQDYSHKPVYVDISSLLGVKPKSITRYLNKHIGDFIYKGDYLAKRVERSPEGPVNVFVKSPATGTIESIDTNTGIMRIVYKNKSLDFPAHVHGKVLNVIEFQSIELEYEAKQLEGMIGFGTDCHGTLSFITDPQALRTEDHGGKVVVFRYAPSASELHKAAEAGARGLICGHIAHNELSGYLGFDPGLINTGSETLPAPLLVLSGFGNSELPATIWDELHQYQGHHCYLAPHTRIRAGVIRPFLAIQ